jgi:serine/threonine protein kinase
MKVHVKGKGQVDLTSNDFVAEGGQGKIYSKGNVVYKVYHDPKKMIPVAKIQELHALTTSNIVKPEDLLMDGKNKLIGYTMRFVPNTHPLCKLFTKAFRQREQVTEGQIVGIVQKMRETVRHIHDHKMLIVDLNEMNFLVPPKFDDVYFIDVDSYQTPSYHATALMESVRDRHMTPGHFTELTDWFSFGVVSFQLFIGIHPYKGKHPKYTGVDALDERMKDNISVLNKAVAMPAVCYPLANIPKGYLDWYKRLFEKGERLPPPENLHAAVVVVAQVKKISGSNFFDIAEVAVGDKDIINYFYSNNAEIIVTEDSVYYNGRQDALSVKNPVFGFTPKMNHPIGAYPHNGFVRIYDLIGGQELHQCSGKAVMSHDNRLYAQNDISILEVQIFEGQKTFVSMRAVGNCLENATQMFDGVVIQNLLGSYYASFFPVSGQCHQVALKELNGYKVLDAKFDNGVLMVVVSKAGKYNRLVMRFDKDWTYDVREVKDITYSGLNFTTLDNGICVCIDEDERVEIFSNTKDRADVKEINDPAIDGSMKLFHKGTKVLFAKGNKMFGMTMRKRLNSDFCG